MSMAEDKGPGGCVHDLVEFSGYHANNLLLDIPCVFDIHRVPCPWVAHACGELSEGLLLQRVDSIRKE